MASALVASGSSLRAKPIRQKYSGLTWYCSRSALTAGPLFHPPSFPLRDRHERGLPRLPVRLDAAIGDADEREPLAGVLVPEAFRRGSEVRRGADEAAP